MNTQRPSPAQEAALCLLIAIAPGAMVAAEPPSAAGIGVGAPGREDLSRHWSAPAEPHSASVPAVAPPPAAEGRGPAVHATWSFAGEVRISPHPRRFRPHVGGPPTLDGDALGVMLAALAVTSAVVIPIAVLDDRYGSARFPAHPYAGDAPGGTLIGAGLERARAADAARWWSGRLRLDGVRSPVGMARLGARIGVDTAWRVGAEVGWSWLEPADEAEEGGTEAIGDAVATWRFAHSPRVQFRIGAGVAQRRDQGGTARGFQFLYGVEAFPLEPLVLSACFRWSDVDGDLQAQAQAAVGAMLGPIELQAGVELLRFDGERALGPMLGIRYWF